MQLMYAIAFDLDTAKLKQNYSTPSHENAYGDVEKVLVKHGFKRQQGSVYYGDETINVVATILAVQDVSKTYAWFKPSVKDIRILQLLGNDDLKPLL